jgi:Domain of unknown function (DUF1893).
MNMDHIIELLHKGKYSCVISNGSEIRTFVKGGVIDLYELYNNDLSFLNNSSVADKVVGKAAATLMILGDVAHIYADVISEPAIALLNNTPIGVKSGKTVPFIENRDKSGICPLENLCSHTGSLQELFPSIKEFVEKMRK